jgi:uncharacterized protein
MKKIDLFAHCSPQKFMNALAKLGKTSIRSEAGDPSVVGGPALWDINKRLEIIEGFEDYFQLLVPASSVIENFNPRDAVFLAQTFNEAVAEWASQHPEKFVGAVATIALGNIDEALKEIDRAITDLGCKGIMLPTPVHPQGLASDVLKPLDAPEFWPIYGKMAKYDLPIWIHPGGITGVPYYPGEPKGKYGLFHVFGWPIESMMAMSRLIYSGVLTKYPNLKIITHHCGSMIIPALGSRIEDECADYGIGGAMKWDTNGVFKNKSPLDYFKMFYGDTALYGGSQALDYGLKFFRPEHLVFGTDCPWDGVGGARFIKSTIDAVNRMSISDSERELIFSGNARRLLHLGIV